MSWWLKLFWQLFAADCVVWAAAWRTLSRRPLPWRWSAVALHLFFAAMAGGMALLLVSHSRGRYVDDAIPGLLAAAIFIWHLIVLPLALAGVVVAVIWKAVMLLIGLFRKPRESAPPPHEGLTRREFLARACALAPPSLTLLLSVVAEAQLRGFRIRRITVPLAALPPALDGMTIVNIADTHTGRFTHGAILDHIAAAANDLQPDLVFFAGDLINDSLAWLDQGIAMLKKIRAPLFVCEGNHDLFEAPSEFRRRVKASGINLLVNEAARASVRGVPIQILGMQWGIDSKEIARNRKSELAACAVGVMKLRDPALFPILLAHHPHAWDYVSGIPLTISGHTHGGQIMLTNGIGFGPEIFRYWSGLYTQKVGQPAQGEALVVSNGTGNWFPLRVNAPAEIVHITLRRATT